MSELYTLFPTPVRVLRGVISEEERQEILNLDAPLLKNFTGVDLYHTEVEYNYFDKYKSRMTEACKELSVDLFCEELDWIITAMWMNVGHPGVGHHTHNHVNSFISGVLYIDNVVEHTKFFRPLQTLGFVMNNVVPNVSNIFNAEYAMLDSLRNRDMILFPSYLQHCVDPNPTQQNRVTVSFNAIPKKLNVGGYCLTLGK